MLTLFYDGDTIEGVGARVEGGLAVVANAREDVGRLANLCLDLWRHAEPSEQTLGESPATEFPHERLLRVLYGRLIAESDQLARGEVPFHPAESRELASLLDKLHGRSIEPEVEGESGEGSTAWHSGSVDPFESLALGLAGIWETWDHHDSGREQRRGRGGPPHSGVQIEPNLILAIPTPGRARSASVQLRFA